MGENGNPVIQSAQQLAIQEQMPCGMSEIRMQILFDALLFVIPAVLVFFVWRGVKADLQVQGRKGQNLLLFSTVMLSCNILLLYCCYVTDLLVMRGHSISEASATEYKFLSWLLWSSRIAVLVSIATVIMALFSQRGLARKLCILGQCGRAHMVAPC
jgi:hypothetical protein